MKTIKLLTISISLLLILISNVGFSQTPVKRVLVEEYTGAWCSSCAFGGVYSKHLENNFPNSIFVAIHSNDSMENTTVKFYMANYFSSLPTFLYDRKDFPQNPATKAAVSAYPWATGLDTLDHYINKVYNTSPLATVGISQVYDSVTRQLSVTVSANFIANASGSFRLNCFIVEDSVTGGSAYDQTNSNFSGWTSGPAYLSSLISAPSIITGYVHNHVLREMLGTPAGATAGIPTTVVAGNSYSKTFNYTVPLSINHKKISLVGVVQRYGSNIVADREVVNANSQPLYFGSTTASIKDLEEDFITLSIYPNPIVADSKIEFYVKNDGEISCDLYNMQGQVVKHLFNKHFVAGEYRINLNDINLSNGTYMIKFTKNQKSIIKRIVVSN